MKIKRRLFITKMVKTIKTAWNDYHSSLIELVLVQLILLRIELPRRLFLMRIWQFQMIPPKKLIVNPMRESVKKYLAINILAKTESRPPYFWNVICELGSYLIQNFILIGCIWNYFRLSCFHFDTFCSTFRFITISSGCLLFRWNISIGSTF